MSNRIDTPKIFILTIIICVVSLFISNKEVFSSLKSATAQSKEMFEYFPKNEGRFSDILLKIFKRNKDENLIIAIDSNRFIGLSKEEDAYFVKDMRSGKKTIIHKITKKNFLSIAENWDGRYFYWIEGERKKGFLQQSCRWALYAYDITTNKKYLIDTCGEGNLPVTRDMKAKSSIMWRDIFGHNGKVVYVKYEKGNNGIVYQVIKVCDVATKKYFVVDKVPERENRFTYPPSIYDNNIVWCVSELVSTHSMATEDGEIYLYNLKTNVKRKISPNSELVMPRIYKNYVVALRLPNSIHSQTQIVLCDISKQPYKWKIIVYPSLYPTKNNTIFTFADPYISGGYLSWYGNYLKDGIYIFSLKDLKYYKIPYLKVQKEYSNNIMLYSESPTTSLFLRSYEKDNSLNSYSEYLILK